MLKKENRLTKDNDFDRAFKSGRSSYGRLLGIKAINNNLNDNRFGTLVSLKVSKLAVERNKIKRQIRAIVKNEAPLFNGNYDVVIVVHMAVLRIRVVLLSWMLDRKIKI